MWFQNITGRGDVSWENVPLFTSYFSAPSIGPYKTLLCLRLMFECWCLGIDTKQFCFQTLGILSTYVPFCNQTRTLFPDTRSRPCIRTWTLCPNSGVNKKRCVLVPSENCTRTLQSGTKWKRSLYVKGEQSRNDAISFHMKTQCNKKNIEAFIANMLGTHFIKLGLTKVFFVFNIFGNYS